jgi:dihydrofolate synthase/folylpolyglutamate synthase
VDVVIDVAHNPQAARQVADWLARNPVNGRTLAVFAALGDKDVAGIAGALEPQIARWFLAGLAHESNRGLDAHALARRIGAAVPTSATDMHATVRDACRAARAEARPGDRILVFGSFFTAAAALACYERPAEADAPL